MILKGSQRAGATALADHLLSNENDHVTVVEIKGFIAEDLYGALREAQAISKVTQCKQFLFSLSLNPPESHVATEAELRNAADRAEETLGLSGQPRAVIIHEKEGRRHAHAVWSRIDAQSLTAIRMSHFKSKLMALSKELFLDHGWDLPDGLKSHGGKNPLNFTLDEWQQAKRIERDPREIKQELRRAWDRSDSQQGLSRALEERGYFLSRGDRRSVVVLDTEGNVFALSRWSGLKAKDIKARITDPEALPSVSETKDHIRSRMSEQMRCFIKAVKDKQAEARQPLLDEKARLVALQREERHALSKTQNDRSIALAQQRAGEFRKGLKGMWDWMTGKKADLRRDHAEKLAAERAQDARDRQALVERQMQARQELQLRFKVLRQSQKSERSILARQIAQSLQRMRRSFGSFDHEHNPTPPQKRFRRDLSLGR